MSISCSIRARWRRDFARRPEIDAAGLVEATSGRSVLLIGRRLRGCELSEPADRMAGGAAHAAVVYVIYRSYRLYVGKLEDGKIHAEEMSHLHLRTIEALALAIEAKDHNTHEHLQRVRVYAMEMRKNSA